MERVGWNGLNKLYNELRNLHISLFFEKKYVHTLKPVWLPFRR